MLTSEQIKKRGLELGADVVGIGSIDRWKGAPIQMDPRQIMPECRSVIGLVFRVLRGSLRGIEEGTHFANYAAQGYGGVTHIIVPPVLRQMCRMIEDDGYEAMPFGQQDEWRAIDNPGNMKVRHSVPVAEGKGHPDVILHTRIAGFLCGLGEIGYSKMFLTPQFGPRNRLFFILTELELDPDPIYDGPPLCNKCMACVRDCPGNAISATETVKVNLAGHEVEWGKLNSFNCDIAFRGGGEISNDKPLPDSKEYVFGNVHRSAWSPFYKKPNNIYWTGQAVCGGRGCIRACMISLESRGVLGNTFKQKFRRRKPWSVNWSQYAHLDENPEDVPDYKMEVDK
jgi:epoxyqueuosine reductase